MNYRQPRYSSNDPQDRNGVEFYEPEGDCSSDNSVLSEEESYLDHLDYFKHMQAKYQYTNELNDQSNNSEHTRTTTKVSRWGPPVNSDPTSARLDRLEALLVQLINKDEEKAATSTRVSPPSPTIDNIPESVIEKEEKVLLDPCKCTFTTSMWIQKIEEIKLKNNWDEKVALAFTVKNMPKVMNSWYQNVKNFNWGWKTYKAGIRKLFPDNSDYVTTMKKMITRVKLPDEPMNYYYHSKLYLIEACKITGLEAVALMIDGLNNKTIQEQATLQNFLSTDTLYEKFLKDLPKYQVDYVPTNQSTFKKRRRAGRHNRQVRQFATQSTSTPESLQMII